MHSKKENGERERVWSNKKLVWYRRVKTDLKFEDFLKNEWVRGRRLVSKLRSGVLQLAVETGRWEGVERLQRVCRVCERNVVEDERHFIEDCPFYEGVMDNVKMNVCDVMRGLDKGMTINLVKRWDVRKRVIDGLWM